MALKLPLSAVRIHLSGSVPDDATPDQATQILTFVRSFSQAVLRNGGSIIHGTHPSFLGPLSEIGRQYAAAGGRKDSLTLVRAAKFASTLEQEQEITDLRQFASVQVLPTTPGGFQENLVPIREWMAERSDVIVALGGRHYQANPDRAGVPFELEEMLARGKPAFVLEHFGGAVADYVDDHPHLFSRLRNGLSIESNRTLSTSPNISTSVSAIIEQLKLLPLGRETLPNGRLFRVLALDGGGLRGAFTAAVLAKWNDMLSFGETDSLIKHFDMVAGTSTGAILAIGLGLGIPTSQMLAFYRDKGPQIFPSDRSLRHWLRSKYESSTLRDVLTGTLNGSLLRDSCCRLVIPTVRAKHGEAEAIVTPHSADRTAFKDITAVDAALASSAAPTYFDEAHVVDALTDIEYLDGGIWANNPVLPAIAEAIRHLNVPIDRIDVLNVGTMGNEADFTSSLRKGKAGWAPSSADLFFAAQEAAANTLATTLLTSSRHLRVNQQTPTAIKLDNVQAIEDMVERGVNVAKDTFISVRSRFLDGFHAADWKSS